MAEELQGVGRAGTAGAEAGTAPEAQVVTRIAPAAAGGGRGKLTLAEVRSKLDGKTGRRFWKNLDQLAEDPEFHEADRRGVSAAVDRVDRRAEPARLS